LSLDQPAHSVLVLRIVDRDVPAAAPEITASCPDSATAGNAAGFSARSSDAHPAVSWHWSFGDGVHLDGASKVSHAWTEPGDYQVHVNAAGLDNMSGDKDCKIHVTGHLPTVFTPPAKKRYEGN
jgi:hypothetical protein